MRRVQEILQLKHECGASDRAIGRSLGSAHSTITLTLDRVAAAGLAWPLSAMLSDRLLEALLYAGARSRQGMRRKVERDWPMCTASCAGRVSRSCCCGRGELGLNRTYLYLTTHYGTAILPVRVRRPRDKAKVEVALLVTELTCGRCAA
jgi:hypothetical protein